MCSKRAGDRQELDKVKRERSGEKNSRIIRKNDFNFFLTFGKYSD